MQREICKQGTAGKQDEEALNIYFSKNSLMTKKKEVEKYSTPAVVTHIQLRSFRLTRKNQQSNVELSLRCRLKDRGKSFPLFTENNKCSVYFALLQESLSVSLKRLLVTCSLQLNVLSCSELVWMIHCEQSQPGPAGYHANSSRRQLDNK